MAAASTTTEPAAVGWVNRAAERRRRSYAMLDAADPARGRAVRICEFALDFRRTGDVEDARALLRDALGCGAHRPTIYRAWIAMEEEQRSPAEGVRELFEGWRASYDAARRLRSSEGGGGGEGGGTPPAAAEVDEDEGAFWCRYIAFELHHGGGGAARVRAVAERALAACPRDPAVHARYARAEMRLGCPDRARAVLESAIDACAADAEAREWLRKQAAACGASVGEGGWKRLRGLLPFCRGRRSGSAEAYKRVGVA